jgi:hypothetical protein
LRSGTRTSSKKICAVSDEAMPIFLSLRARSTPLASMGTMSRLLFLCGCPSAVFTRQHIQSACMPLVIHILPPFTTQSPPSLRAWVLMAATSEPAPGSLTPMQPTTSPAIDGRRYSSLSSLLANLASAGVHMSVCTPMAMATPPVCTRPSVSAMTTEYE